MHRTPYRAEHDVSQPFNSGLVTIYDVQDRAKPGYAPDLFLARKAVLRYEEQRVGVTRYYAAQQANNEVDKVIRVPASAADISAQDAARLQDGLLYRIDFVQTVPGAYPRSLDLTLSRMEQIGDKDAEAVL